MRLFISVFLIFFLAAYPANACPEKPEGEYAFPARLEPISAHGTVYFAKYKSALGRECTSGHHLNFYAIYEYPVGDMFVAAVTYYDGKPSEKARFYRGFYNPFQWVPEDDPLNVPAGEFRHSDYLCCPPECLDDGFVTCVNSKLSKKFPLDIFFNLPSAKITCPAVNFFGADFDLCFIYEAMRLFKYPIAAALVIKLFLYL